MDMVIRESMRLNVVWVALRRNVERDITLAGGSVKQGEFLAYNMYDTHMDPEIYTDPTSFDPSRFAPGGQEDQKAPMAYLGWGAGQFPLSFSTNLFMALNIILSFYFLVPGRHPCTGTKVAKVEMKVVIALLLLTFEYKLVDANGNPVHKVPVMNKNDYQQGSPSLKSRCSMLLIISPSLL